MFKTVRDRSSQIVNHFCRAKKVVCTKIGRFCSDLYEFRQCLRFERYKKKKK